MQRNGYTASAEVERRGLLAAGIIIAVFALGLSLFPVASNGGAISVSRKSELVNLVRQDCGSCHGMTLKGGLGRSLLPGDLAETPAPELAEVILDGVPGTPMPPWRGLISPEEARWIADRLKQGLVQ